MLHIFCWTSDFYSMIMFSPWFVNHISPEETTSYFAFWPIPGPRENSSRGKRSPLGASGENLHPLEVWGTLLMLKSVGLQVIYTKYLHINVTCILVYIHVPGPEDLSLTAFSLKKPLAVLYVPGPRRQFYKIDFDRQIKTFI